MPNGSLSTRLPRFLTEPAPALAILHVIAKMFRRRPLHPFDRAHRVETGGLIYADGLSSGHPHDQYSAGYYATAPSLFQGIIMLWAATLGHAALNLGDYTFLDIGSGKGRVVLLASQLPFRSIVGVELNPALARAAKRNLKSWLRTPRACSQINLVSGDVFSVPIPDGPVVLFLFNSFERELVQMLLDRLVAVSAARVDPIDLLYVHPEFDELVRQTPSIELLAREEIPFSAEDAAADVFGVSCDHCSIYRLPGLRTI